METESPPTMRPLGLVRSPAFRLTLMIALAVVALIAPLIQAVRATAEADSARQQSSDRFLGEATSPPPAFDVNQADLEAEDQVGDEGGFDEGSQPIEATRLVAGVPATTTQSAGATVIEPAVAAQACIVASPTAADAAGPHAAWFSDNFSDRGTQWRSLAGSWVVDNGMFIQNDPDGYDLIAELALPLPSQFSISVTLVPQGEPLGGGLVVAQPTPMLRNGATVVDFTDEGRFLRWGTYDDAAGDYRYLGGVAMRADFDPSSSHTLTVLVTGDRTTVLVDGALVGTLEAVGLGQVGLVTSAASMAFDDLTIESLTPSSISEVADENA